MSIRIKRQLRGKDGGIHPHNKSAQDFPHVDADPAEHLRTLTKNYLGLLNLWSARWEQGSCMEVTTACIAVENLLRLLEREQP